MARTPNKQIEQAKELFLKGTKLVDIAKQLDVPEGTVRRWKCTHKWDSERSDKKSERSDKKKSDLKRNKKEAVVEEVEQVIENPDLTDKQRLFCVYYIKSFNATKAYQKAYGVKYETAASAGPRMLENVRVKEAIKKLKQGNLNRKMLSEEDLFQKYMDIAFADITDYVEFGRETVPVMGAFGPIFVKNEETGEKQAVKKEINIVRFKESDMVDGTAISEVKQGRDGASIKLADRMKALQWLTEHMNLATEEQKARIALLKAKEKEYTGGDDPGNENIINFLKALRPSQEELESLFESEGEEEYGKEE